MDILDRIAEITGVKYEDLREEERKQAMAWVDMISAREIGLDDVKNFVSGMKSAVENELSKESLSRNQDLFLKARLKNLLLLEAFLDSPEKAKKALDNYLTVLSRMKGKNASRI